MDDNDISWCNYAIGSDTDNDTNALLVNSADYTFGQISAGHWPDGLISASGLYTREQFLKVPVETDDTETDEETDEDDD